MDLVDSIEGDFGAASGATAMTRLLDGNQDGARHSIGTAHLVRHSSVGPAPDRA